MGEVLQFSSINNLQVLLSNEGFHNTRVVYLGGLWVMIESKSSKSNLIHRNMSSFNAWTRSTFQKISSKWGELVELEDGYDDLFARKRICIKTSQTENILESFKLIVKGKILVGSCQGTFCLSLSFKDVPEKELFSDDESTKINEQANNLNNDEVENASEVVSDTYSGDNGEDQGFEHQHISDIFLPNNNSRGPFIINEILARCKLKKQQAMIFKVDFAKAYDSVRWDYLDDVLISFGFGPKWRSWIRGSLSSGKASILVNGSPTTEFHYNRA
ncbi:RNA-directed DNA polymerase, eukaryota [Tanacetum coccineum]